MPAASPVVPNIECPGGVFQPIKTYSRSAGQWLARRSSCDDVDEGCSLTPYPRHHHDIELWQGRAMEQNKPDYWFAVKLYGWGWGLPVRWQGWVVLALYGGSIDAGIRYMRPQNDVSGFIWWLLISSAILVAIVAWKGERPLAWRWGKK
jgi:hypothetical protein